MKTLKRSFKLGMLPVILAVVLLLGIQSPSHAVLQLYLDDGAGNTKLAIDNVINDSDPVLGSVVIIGALGSGVWTSNVVSVTTPTGTTQIDLSDRNTSNASGTLLIMGTDTDFGPLSGNQNFSGTVGGTQDNGTVEFKWYVDANNALFGPDGTTTGIGGNHGTLITALGPLSANPFSGGASGPATLSGPFSMTLASSVVHTGAGVTSYDQNLRTVPEPATLILLGSGLLGAALYRRLRKPKG